MAVSRENGLEAYLIYDSPLTSKTFVEIFDELDKKGKHWKLFGDNASWQKSKITTNELAKRGKKMSYNLVKFPQLNPIEVVFS